jgi:hypothetical protein
MVEMRTNPKYVIFILPLKRLDKKSVLAIAKPPFRIYRTVTLEAFLMLRLDMPDILIFMPSLSTP